MRSLSRTWWAERSLPTQVDILHQTTVIWSAVYDELNGVYENYPFIAVSPTGSEEGGPEAERGHRTFYSHSHKLASSSVYRKARGEKNAIGSKTPSGKPVS